jgi:hypothetical protein
MEWLLAPDSGLTATELGQCYGVEENDVNGKEDGDLARGQLQVWQLILLGCAADVWQNFARSSLAARADAEASALFFQTETEGETLVDYEEDEAVEDVVLRDQEKADQAARHRHSTLADAFQKVQVVKRKNLLDGLAQTLSDQWQSKMILFLGLDEPAFDKTKGRLLKIVQAELQRAFPVSAKLRQRTNDTHTHNILLDHPLVRKFANTWQVQVLADPNAKRYSSKAQTCFDHVWWVARNNYLGDIAQLESVDADTAKLLHASVTPETDQFQIPLLPPSRYCQGPPETCPKCSVVSKFAEEAQNEISRTKGTQHDNMTEVVTQLLNFPVQLAVCSSVGRWRLLRPVGAAVSLRPLLRLSQNRSQFSSKVPLDVDTGEFAAAELNYLDRVARSFAGVQNPDTGLIRGQSQITTRHVNKLLYLSVTNTKHIDAVTRDERNVDSHMPDKGGTFGRMDWGTTVQSQMSHTIVQQYNKADRQVLWVCQECHTPLAPGAKLVCPQAQWDRDLKTAVTQQVTFTEESREDAKKTVHELHTLLTHSARTRFYGEGKRVGEFGENADAKEPDSDVDEDMSKPAEREYNTATRENGDKFTLVGSMQATSTAALIGVAGNMQFTFEPNKVTNKNTEIAWDELANPEVSQMRRVAARDF